MAADVSVECASTRYGHECMHLSDSGHSCAVHAFHIGDHRCECKPTVFWPWKLS